MNLEFNDKVREIILWQQMQFFLNHNTCDYEEYKKTLGHVLLLKELSPEDQSQYEEIWREKETTWH